MDEIMATDGLTPPHLAAILVRLLCAFALGALIAYRPWRHLLPNRVRRVLPETAQAQTIIAVSGALMIVVIGDSLARAFGLVGLGTFIRFRAAIKDPRDVAIMLITIAVGMACGLGFIPTAATATVFVVLILALFDRFGHRRRRRLRVSVFAQDPVAVQAVIRSAFPDARAISLPKERTERGAVSLELEVDEHEDAASILEALERSGAGGIEKIRIDKQS
jgi:uncharacterized membrane protein YhiD involved in acid resistance